MRTSATPVMFWTRSAMKRSAKSVSSSGLCRVLVSDRYEDRLRIRLDLGDDRFVDLVRHAPAHAADAVAHVGGRDVGIDVGAEAHGDLAALLAAGRGDDLDAFDAGDRVLQDLRDLGLDDLGGGAAIDRLHRDDRLVDIGIFADGEAAIADDADQHHQQAQHRREDGPADEELEQAHQSWLVWTGFSLMEIALPSRKRIWPAVMICILGVRPLTISTLPGSRLPSSTATRRAFPFSAT